MNHGHTTEFIVADTVEGYFVAKLDNGGVRVGLVNEVCFDFPQHHQDFDRASKLTSETVEEFHDEHMSVYCQECSKF